MGSSGSSQPEHTSKAIRYAPYIEEKHIAMLSTVVNTRKDIINTSPYTSYTDHDINTAMLGIGYTIADFPSLYDMFGKFMSGYDLEVLWDTTFNDQLQADEVNVAIKAMIALSDDDLSEKSIPEFKLHMRENNAVPSSSFVINKANIECKRTKDLSVISADAKFKLLPNLNTKYNAALNWQKGVTDSYTEIMKLYYLSAMAGIDADNEFAFRNVIWPFTVLDFEQVVLGSMQRSAGYNKYVGKRKRSDLSKVFLVASYTAQGAAIGSMFPGWGTVIGAVVGFVIGVAIVMSE